MIFFRESIIIMCIIFVGRNDVYVFFSRIVFDIVWLVIIIERLVGDVNVVIFVIWVKIIVWFIVSF